MSPNHRIPYLSLAPEIDHNLSATSVSDYWTLFRWIFLFPQAITDYLDDGKEGGAYSQKMLALVIMTIVLTLAILALFAFLQAIWLRFADYPGLLLGISGLVMADSFLLALLPVSLVVLVGLAWNWTPSLFVLIPTTAISSDIACFALLRHLQGRSPAVPEQLVSFFLLGASYGLLYSLAAASINYGIPDGRRLPIYSVVFAVPAQFLAIASTLLSTEPVSIAAHVLQFVAATGISMVGFLLVAIRPEDWLIARITWNSESSRPRYVPHVTLLQLTQIENSLGGWFRTDWDLALGNARELWIYTRQHRAIANAIIDAMRQLNLNLQSENITRLANVQRYPWNPIWFLPGGAPLVPRLLESRGDRQPLKLRMPPAEKLDLEHPADFVLATAVAIESGDQKQLEALASYGQGWKARGFLSNDVTKALDILSLVHNVVLEPDIELPKPETKTRSSARKAIDRLYEIFRYAYLIRRCESRRKREYARDQARQRLFELRADIENDEAIFGRQEERFFEIIDRWLGNVDHKEHFTGNASTLSWTVAEPENPFVYDEPLKTPALIRDRSEAYRHLMHAWEPRALLVDSLGPRTQVIEILGPALAGKTSVFLTANDMASLSTQTVHVSLKHLNTDIPAESRIAYAICDELREYAVEYSVSKEEIREEPYRQLERMIRSMCKDRDSGLIIGLDEFEYLERVVDKSDQFGHFLQFMFHLCEMIPRLGLAIIGPLDRTIRYERSRQHANRFARPVRIRCLSRRGPYSAVEDLLQHPIPLFYHRFTTAAIDEISRLTNGHPYLVQLIAWNVLDRFNTAQYNGSRFVRRKEPIDPLFDVKDVTAILEGEIFLQGYRYYYNRLIDDFPQLRDRVIEILDYIRGTTNLRFSLATLLAYFKFDSKSAEAGVAEEILAGLVEQGVLSVNRRGLFRLEIRLLSRSDPRIAEDDGNGT